jgi:hypothetical protein
MTQSKFLIKKYYKFNVESSDSQQEANKNIEKAESKPKSAEVFKNSLSAGRENLDKVTLGPEDIKNRAKSIMTKAGLSLATISGLMAGFNQAPAMAEAQNQTSQNGEKTEQVSHNRGGENSNQSNQNQESNNGIGNQEEEFQDGPNGYRQPPASTLRVGAKYNSQTGGVDASVVYQVNLGVENKTESIKIKAKSEENARVQKANISALKICMTEMRQAGQSTKEIQELITFCTENARKLTTGEATPSVPTNVPASQPKQQFTTKPNAENLQPTTAKKPDSNPTNSKY